MNEDPEGFLGRWSRLKQLRRKEVEPAAMPEQETPGRAPIPSSGEPAEGQAAGVEEGSDDSTLNLPPVESLDKDSDFTAFLQEGVPEDVQRLALRKLWTSDPVFANLDGLLEYGEDFSAPWRTHTVIKTLYRVGQGMPALLAEAEEESMVEADVAGANSDVSDSVPADPDCSAESTGVAADVDPVDAPDSTEEPGGDGQTSDHTEM